MVNALVHRDYLIDAPVRIFMFDDRVEIISPGHLPNHLTVAKIRAGNSVIRNPILVSFASKGLLPYRGLGSGIKRALEDWPGIEFKDDHEENLFVSVVPKQGTLKSAEGTLKRAEGTLKSTEGTLKNAEGTLKSTEGTLKSSEGTLKSPKEGLKGSLKILAALNENPNLTALSLVEKLGTSLRAIRKNLALLQARGLLRRVGPDKGGHWEVLDPGAPS